jgi:hypothetical protein
LQAATGGRFRPYRAATHVSACSRVSNTWTSSTGAELYAVEKDIRGHSAEERRFTRQQKSRPLADTFQKWLRTKLGLISQKGKLAEAIRYALTRWEGLTRFIDDGRIGQHQSFTCRFISMSRMAERPAAASRMSASLGDL